MMRQLAFTRLIPCVLFALSGGGAAWADIDRIETLVEIQQEVQGRRITGIQPSSILVARPGGNIYFEGTTIDSLGVSLGGLFDASGGGEVVAVERDSTGIVYGGSTLTFDGRFASLHAGGGVLGFAAGCSGSCSSEDLALWKYANGVRENIYPINGSGATPLSFAAGATREIIDAGFRDSPLQVAVSDSGRIVFAQTFRENLGTSSQAYQFGVWAYSGAQLSPLYIVDNLNLTFTTLPTVTADSPIQDLAITGSGNTVLFEVVNDTGVAWYSQQGLQTRELARAGDPIPVYGGNYASSGGRFFPGPGEEFVAELTRPGSAGLDEFYFYGVGTGDLQAILPDRDVYGRVNLTFTDGTSTSFTDTGVIFGSNDRIYFDVDKRGLDPIFTVAPNALSSYELLLNRNTVLPGLIDNTARRINLFEVADNGTILFSATQDGERNWYLRSDAGDFQALPSINDSFNSATILNDNFYRFASDTSVISYIETIDTSAIYQFTFSFPELLPIFVWNGSHCASDNWHAACGSTNFDNDAGEAQATLPGAMDEVRIVGAESHVVIDAEPVSIKSILAEGHLTIAQPLSLATSSTLGGVDLKSDITFADMLTLRGDALWTSGNITGGVLEMVAGSTMTVDTDATVSLDAETRLTSASLVLDGGTLALGKTLTVSEQGASVLMLRAGTIDGTGEIVLNGGLDKTGLDTVTIKTDLNVGESANVVIDEGSLVLAGSDNLLRDTTINGGLTIQDTGAWFAGQTTIDGAGEVVFRNALVDIDAGLDLALGAGASARIENSSFSGIGTLNNTGNMEVMSGHFHSAISNSGTLSVKAPDTATVSLNLLEQVTLTNTGRVTVEAGGSLGGDGTIDNQQAGTLAFDAGSFDVPATLTIQNAGEFQAGAEAAIVIDGRLVSTSGHFNLGAASSVILNGNSSLGGTTVLQGDGSLVINTVVDGAQDATLVSSLATGGIEVRAGALNLVDWQNNGKAMLTGGDVDVATFSNEGNTNVDSDARMKLGQANNGGMFSIESGAVAFDSYSNDGETVLNNATLMLAGNFTNRGELTLGRSKEDTVTFDFTEGQLVNDGNIVQSGVVISNQAFQNNSNFEFRDGADLIGVLYNQGEVSKTGKGSAAVERLVLDSVDNGLYVDDGTLRIGRLVDDTGSVLSVSKEANLIIDQAEFHIDPVDSHISVISGLGDFTINQLIAGSNIRIDANGTLRDGTLDSYTQVLPLARLRIDNGSATASIGSLYIKEGGLVVVDSDVKNTDAEVYGVLELHGNFSDFLARGGARIEIDGTDLIIGRMSAEGGSEVNVAPDSSIVVNDFFGIYEGTFEYGNWNIGANASVDLYGYDQRDLPVEWKISRIGIGASLRLGPGARFANLPNVQGDFETAKGSVFDINDSIRVSATFTNAGTVKGKGSILTELFVNDGTVAPGASPGRLTIDGNYTQSSSGTLQIEIAGPVAADQYDQLDVSGTATLSEGSSIDVTLLDGYVPENHATFEVLTAGQITAEDALDAILNFTNTPANLRWQYEIVDGTSLKLEVLLGSLLAELPSLNPWDLEVAAAIDNASVIGDSAAFVDFALLLDGQNSDQQKSASLEAVRFAGLPQAGQLSMAGARAAMRLVPDRTLVERRGGSSTFAYDTGSLGQALASGGARASRFDHVRVSLSGTYQDGRFDATPFGESYEYDGGGVGAAVEWLEDRWRIGVGIARSDFDGVTSGATQASQSTNALYLFGDVVAGQWTIEGNVAFGRGTLETARSFYVGSTRFATQGNADTSATNAALTAGYNIDQGNRHIIPFVTLQADSLHIDRMTETGSVNRLDIDAGEQRYKRGVLGVRFEQQSGALYYLAKVAWEKVLSASADARQARFAATTSGTFAMPAEDYGDDDAMRVQLALTGELTDRISARLRYDGRFGRDTDLQGISAQLRWSF